MRLVLKSRRRRGCRLRLGRRSRRRGWRRGSGGGGFGWGFGGGGVDDRRMVWGGSWCWWLLVDRLWIKFGGFQGAVRRGDGLRERFA